MIGRMGFRRLLPILFTVVHVALLVYASEHRYDTPSRVQKAVFHYAAFQEDSGVRWDPVEPKPLTAAQKLAIVLNLPALLLAIPIAVVFLRGDDMASLYAAVPFVPLVWYGIGRWVDGLLGYIPRSRRVSRKWYGFFVVIFAVLLCLSLASVTPMNHHRTGDTYWIGFALISWSGLFLGISIFESGRTGRC